jgi:hypothetical protein
MTMLSTLRRAAAKKGGGPEQDLVRSLKKQGTLFQQLNLGVQEDLRNMGKIEGCKRLQSLLTEEERKSYVHSLVTNMGFPKPIAENVDKSAFGLPLMGASIYSHMFAGLGNYAMKKKGVDKVTDAMRVSTYYRTPVVSEELHREGYTDDEVYEIVAKNFYMQYWSGHRSTNPDPKIMNPMARAFYPVTGPMSSGGVDLGRETEMQSVKLYCMGVEGMNQPVTVINTGDTGPFTDGAMHCLQHMIEAAERGYHMPIIFLINANNSAISSRIDYGDHYGDNGDYGIERIQKRFDMWGGLVNPGFTTHAEDVAGGIESMRKAVDLVLETGKPTYCISRFPFRPGGHASDGSPASEEMVLQQYYDFKKILVKQLCDAAPAGGIDGGEYQICWIRSGARSRALSSTHCWETRC